MLSIFLVYFTKCCRSMAWFYQQKIQNQLETKRIKRNGGGLCECHKLPLMSFRKYNMPACFANHVLSNKLHNSAWLHIPTCWNWFNGVFYPEVRKRTCHPVLLLMDNDPGHSKGECCGALFYSQCNKLEAIMRFESCCSCQKEI